MSKFYLVGFAVLCSIDVTRGSNYSASQSTYQNRQRETQTHHHQQRQSNVTGVNSGVRKPILHPQLRNQVPSPVMYAAKPVMTRGFNAQVCLDGKYVWMKLQFKECDVKRTGPYSWKNYKLCVYKYDENGKVDDSAWKVLYLPHGKPFGVGQQQVKGFTQKLTCIWRKTRKNPDPRRNKFEKSIWMLLQCPKDYEIIQSDFNKIRNEENKYCAAVQKRYDAEEIKKVKQREHEIRMEETKTHMEDMKTSQIENKRTRVSNSYRKGYATQFSEAVTDSQNDALMKQVLG